MPILFGNLRVHYDSLRQEIDSAVRRVLDSGWYILGKEVEAFEQEFATYLNVRQCVSVGNGTDAIELALRALGIGVGDEVVTVSHTATFTAMGITGSGAEPVFVDVDERTQTMSAAAVAKALSARTKAIVPVHLYGVPADIDAIREAVADTLPIVEDAAQAHGASLRGRKLGSLGTLGCFSFYPTKNLGALGDGGAVTTDDEALATRLRQLRNGGQADRYHHTLRGVNSRLDELQAAILRAKLPHLDALIARRKHIATRYQLGLADLPGLVLPVRAAPDAEFAYHLYVVRSPHRDELRQALADRGIATQIHYPVPAHLQPAFLDRTRAVLPVTERLCAEVLSLPIYPELTDADVDMVIAAVREAVQVVGA